MIDAQTADGLHEGEGRGRGRDLGVGGLENAARRMDGWTDGWMGGKWRESEGQKCKRSGGLRGQESEHAGIASIDRFCPVPHVCCDAMRCDAMPYDVTC